MPMRRRAYISFLYKGKKVAKFGLIMGFLCLIWQVNAQAPETTENQGTEFWLWNFLAHLHPIAVHFPVGLLCLAGILELFTVKSFSSKWRPAINLLLVTGAIGAIISVIMGLLLARSGDYGKDVLALHQWTGIATAALAIAALFFLNKARKNYSLSNVRTYRCLLLISTAGVSVAGHYGGTLTHGSNYISSTLPWSDGYQPVMANNVNLASFKNDTGKLTAKQEAELNMQVRTVFAHNCYKCHGSEKIKGDLRLDSKEMAFKGGEDGPIIIPGDAMGSELVKRIMLPSTDKKAMPSKDKHLTQDEIDIIKLWIAKGAPWPNDSKAVMFRVAQLQPRNPPLPATTGNLTNPVDLWVNEYFKKNKVEWPKIVDDRTYLRRVYLDIIGLLPTTEEQQAFARDDRPGKRGLWVQQLLKRDDDYATNWLTFWNDALRNDYTGTGYITGGRFNISGWLYTSLQSNKPYNQFVKELLDPTDSSKGFIEGIRWRGVVNASQKTEMQAAQNVSQVFLGLNLKCASCHNSFISNWKLSEAYAFASIFADSALEINRCDKPTGKFTRPAMLWKELGNIDSNATAKIKRHQLSENITQPGNGRLYRTIVNRIWAQLMGRGVVEPVDVMDNEPWSQDLLDWMAYNLVENKCDIKWLVYLITTSNIYQSASVGFKEPNQVIAKDYVFKGMLRKRMSAEQFSDAVSEIIYPVFPDSIKGYRPKLKGDSLAFTRAALVINNPFLIALGRPSRENVVTSRESQANLLQALELTKGERLNNALEKGAESWKAKYTTTDAVISQLYARALGRTPTAKELAVAKKALGNTPAVETIQDLFWAIVLQPEFQIIY